MHERRFERIKPKSIRIKQTPSPRKFLRKDLDAINKHFSVAEENFVVSGNNALMIFPNEEEVERTAREGYEGFRIETIQKEFLRHKDPYWTRQANYEFNRPEIKTILEKFFGQGIFSGKKNPRIVVFAGYSGEFSKTLQEIGFDIIHTDALPEYATKTRMPAYRASAHKIPKIGRVLAFATFEGGITLDGHHGYPFVLKALSRSEKGILIMITKQSLREFKQHAKQDTNINRARVEEAMFEFFSRIYGTTYRVIETEREIFQHFSATPEQQKLIAFDLEVYNFIKKNFSPHNPMKIVDITEVAKKFKISRQQAIEALKRIHLGYAQIFIHAK